LPHKFHQQLELAAPFASLPFAASRPILKFFDGRALRRCERRWKVERLFAWLYNFAAWSFAMNITPIITVARMPNTPTENCTLVFSNQRASVVRPMA